VLLPGERITGVRLAGLVLAFGGLVLAIADEGSATAENPLLGDALAIGGALGWAAVALLARRGGQRGVGPEMQLLWMVTVSGVALLALSLTVGGPPVRAPDAVSVGALVFQATVVVAGAFLVWFWLLDLYPASTVTSFSFLTPILGVTLGWALLGDPVTLSLALGGALVVAGLVLVNRPARPGQVPQKVRSTR
jgi:drug/metabolite transporter (DMT)-like permease